MSFQYTHNSTQSALVAVSNAVRRQLLSKQTNNMDNSDEPEDFLDGKFVFQKNKDGTFNKTKVICTLCGKTLSSKSACDKLTSTVAKWIAKSCRPINMVENEGFIEVLRVATGDSSIKTPQKRTIMTKIHELYEAEKKKRKMTWLLRNIRR